MAREVTVAPPGALPAGGTLRVDVEGRTVAIFRTPAGALFAIEDTCPHRGGPLHEGFLEGDTVFCPWHGWQFDLSSGACLTSRGRDLARFVVREDAAGLHLTLPDAAGQGPGGGVFATRKD